MDEKQVLRFIATGPWRARMAQEIISFITAMGGMGQMELSGMEAGGLIEPVPDGKYTVTEKGYEMMKEYFMHDAIGKMGKVL